MSDQSGFQEQRLSSLFLHLFGIELGKEAVAFEDPIPPRSGREHIVLVRLVGGWFQALAITNRICKSSIRKRITRLQYGGTRL
jgi:hypothetical protein